MNKNKKGFTIVELVVVIAIIAILAAILIPTFGSIIRTAQTSADVHLVKNLNIALSASEARHGRNNTMYDALADAFDAGYDIRKLTPTNADNEILWDQTCDRFVLYVNEKYDVCGRYVDKAVPTGDDTYKLWKIYTSTDDIAADAAAYSIYWNGTAENAPATVSVGFDSGTANVASVEYTNTTETAKDVVIRTNGGTLTIDAENDTVSHYGFATVVNCNDVKVGTYNENGTVGRLIYSDDSGAIKFMPTAVVYCYMNTSTDSNADANNTTKENGATVYTIVNAEVKDAAYGYVEGDGKTAVTVTDGIVQVNNCLNHNDDYDVVTIGNKEYVICKCCGGFSLYVDGEKVELENDDPAKEATVPTTGEGSFNYISPNLEHTSMYWVECASDGFAGGSGTEDDPYLISTPQQLAYLAKTCGGYTDYENYDNASANTYEGKYFKLTQNIDLSGKYWTPIGEYKNLAGADKKTSFKGTFDGDGKEINNLMIVTPASRYRALFGQIEDATITNFTLRGVVLGVDSAGVVAKFTGGTISNIRCYVTVNGMTGITAIDEEQTSLERGKAGGIACLADQGKTCVIDNCHFYGSVTSAAAGEGKGNPVGGILAYANCGQLTISNCSNEGTISSTGTTSSVGGIFAWLAATGDADGCSVTISNCENKGNVSAIITVGGIFGGAGNIIHTTITISNCKVYSTATITNNNVVVTDENARITSCSKSTLTTTGCNGNFIEE